MALLGCNADEWHRLFGIAMVSGGIERVRDAPANHSVLDSLLIALGQSFVDGLAKRCHGLLAIFGKARDIVLRGGPFGRHGARLPKAFGENKRILESFTLYV